MLYSPLRCDGLGLSDGEVMERLWSYLRRFSRMTKEMRPAHRINVLSHALLYYASISKSKLGNVHSCYYALLMDRCVLSTAQLLVRRYKKAGGLRDIAIKTYTHAVSVAPGI